MNHFIDSAVALGAILAVVAVTGCATSGAVEDGDLPEGRIFGASQVDQPARLIACGGYTPPARFLPVLGVTVPVIVGPDGTVKQVGTPRSRSSGQHPDVLDRGVSLARSCVFEPAALDGRPVTVRDEVHFRFRVGSLRLRPSTYQTPGIKSAPVSVIIVSGLFALRLPLVFL